MFLGHQIWLSELHTVSLFSPNVHPIQFLTACLCFREVQHLLYPWIQSSRILSFTNLGSWFLHIDKGLDRAQDENCLRPLTCPLPRPHQKGGLVGNSTGVYLPGVSVWVLDTDWVSLLRSSEWPDKLWGQSEAPVPKGIASVIGSG